MPFNRRQMLQLMTSLAVTTACPAMAWEPESPVELELLHAMPGQDAYFRQVAEAFSVKNPKIRIRFRASPANYPEAHQSILRAAITNKLPDIYHSAWIYFEEAVRQLKKRNAICDVTDLFKAEGDAWAQENYYQSMIDIGTVDGRLYALPFAASTPVFFYNADLVKAAGGDPDNFPTEWEEIIRLGSAIKKLGNADGISFDVEVWPDDWLWQTLILEQGGSLMDKDGKPLTEVQETQVPAFKIVSVFDVSQTEGEPLPSIGVDELAGNVEQYEDFFKALEQTQPVPLRILSAASSSSDARFIRV